MTSLPSDPGPGRGAGAEQDSLGQFVKRPGRRVGARGHDIPARITHVSTIADRNTVPWPSEPSRWWKPANSQNAMSPQPVSGAWRGSPSRCRVASRGTCDLPALLHGKVLAQRAPGFPGAPRWPHSASYMGALNSGRTAGVLWRLRRDSNPGPAAYETAELPLLHGDQDAGASERACHDAFAGLEPAFPDGRELMRLLPVPSSARSRVGSLGCPRSWHSTSDPWYNQGRRRVGMCGARLAAAANDLTGGVTVSDRSHSTTRRIEITLCLPTTEDRP